MVRNYTPRYRKFRAVMDGGETIMLRFDVETGQGSIGLPKRMGVLADGVLAMFRVGESQVRRRTVLRGRSKRLWVSWKTHVDAWDAGIDRLRQSVEVEECRSFGRMMR